jgi:ABC-type ATPase involved in cell division
MNISDNVLKYYLRNVYFINGASFAGKSTIVKMLATGFFTYKRTDYETDIREEVLAVLVKHFGLGIVV